MSIVFSPFSIRTLTLNNRFVRSATWEGMADTKGNPTPPLMELCEKLALGGVGMIIASHTYVRPEGQAGMGQLGLYSDEQTPLFRQFVDAVRVPGTPLCAQIAHAGFAARTKLTGAPAHGPSARVEGFEQTAREMTKEDIAFATASFAQAAARVVQAGFDAVQIHAAHTYLLSQFLSPYFNHRTDEYGGPLENRSRFLLEVYDAVRNAVGESFPVLVKINSSDFLEGGFDVADSLQVCRTLSDRGVDCIEVSGGNLLKPRYRPSRPGKITPQTEAYFRQAAREIKKAVSCPLMLVGGIRSLAVAESLLEDGTADLLSLSRPLIREPGLINRWRSGDIRPSECLSDNRCYEPIYAGEGVYCPHVREGNPPEQG